MLADRSVPGLSSRAPTNDRMEVMRTTVGKDTTTPCMSHSCKQTAQQRTHHQCSPSSVTILHAFFPEFPVSTPLCKCGLVKACCLAPSSHKSLIQPCQLLFLKSRDKEALCRVLTREPSAMIEVKLPKVATSGDATQFTTPGTKGRASDCEETDDQSNFQNIFPASLPL